MSGSVTSSNRSGGGRYRRVGRGDEVDETLFGERGVSGLHCVAGGSPRYRSQSGERGVLRGAGNSSIHGSTRTSKGAAGGAAPVVMRASDLHVMQRRAVIKTSEDLEHEREAALEARRARASKAELRKAKMLALEDKRRAAEPLTELEQEEAEARDRARIMAKHRKEEAMDAVKAMNSMMEYAKTVTIRDRQVEEKKASRAREKEREKVLDLEVEVSRLEEVKKYLDRDAELRVKRAEARKDIEVQMAEARQRRREEFEERQREAARTVARMKEMEEEDRAKEVERRDKKSALRREVKAANEAAIRGKTERREAAIAEDRALEEEQRLATEAAIAAEMEREKERLRREEMFFKLRGAVEKFQDNSEQIAETQMRRAFEAGQRKARHEAEERERKRAEMYAELKRARDEQLKLKEVTRAMEIQKERDEFERNQAARREWMASERRVMEDRRDRDRHHVKAVLQQAEEKLAAVKEARLERRNAGIAGVQATGEEMTKLEYIRERKAKELREAGVDNKYTVQLRRFNPKDVIDKDFKLGPPRIMPKAPK
jgi:hypothetical protein